MSMHDAMCVLNMLVNRAVKHDVNRAMNRAVNHETRWIDRIIRRARDFHKFDYRTGRPSDTTGGSSACLFSVRSQSAIALLVQTGSS
jgi:hypothetical protein